VLNKIFFGAISQEMQHFAMVKILFYKQVKQLTIATLKSSSESLFTAD
jgi:hypothetical protein